MLRTIIACTIIFLFTYCVLISRPTLQVSNAEHTLTHKEEMVWHSLLGIYDNIDLLHIPNQQCYRPDLNSVRMPYVVAIKSDSIATIGMASVLGLFIPRTKVIYYVGGDYTTLRHEMNHYLIDALDLNYDCLNEYFSYVIEEV